MTNSIVPASQDQIALGAKHAARLERQVFAPARRIGVDLSVLAVTESTPEQQLRRSEDGNSWWVASRFDADPVALARSGLTQAPAEVVQGLRSLRTAGVDLDEIYVAHELPGSWVPGTPPPEMVLTGSADHRAASVEATQGTTFAIGLALLQAAVIGAGVAVRSAASAGATIGSGLAAVARFDPVILGGIRDPESDRIAWIPLAAWDESPR